MDERAEVAEPEVVVERASAPALAGVAASASLLGARAGRPGCVLALQRAAGNRATRRWLARETATRPTDETIKKILDGGYRDAAITDTGFSDPVLQKVVDYYAETWKVADHKFATTTGDSGGKDIGDLPVWVRALQEELMARGPRADTPGGKRGGVATPWDQDAAVVQRLVEAYLRGWARKRISGPLPANLGELIARIGASLTNRQHLLMEWGSPHAWCNPASQTAIALSLLERGLRFKGTKPAKLGKQTYVDFKKGPSKPELYKQWRTNVASIFSAEVVTQGAYFLAKWGHAAGTKADPFGSVHGARRLTGKEAQVAPVYPGDLVQVENGNIESPISGHVVTAICEVPEPGKENADWSAEPGGTVLSKLYIVSGNARGAVGRDGAVRAEVVERERPHKDWLWGEALPGAHDYEPQYQAYQSALAKVQTDYGDKMRRVWFDFAKAIGKNTLLTPPGGKFKLSPMMYLGNYMWNGAAMAAAFAQTGQAGFQAKWDEVAQPAYKAMAEATKTHDTEKVYTEIVYDKAPVGKRDATEQARNQQAGVVAGQSVQTGRWWPLKPNRTWVFDILRASQFTQMFSAIDSVRATTTTEAERIAAEDKILDSYGIERMPDDWSELMRKAAVLEFWEGAGASAGGLKGDPQPS